MPVTMIETGKSVMIVRITGSDDIRQHLSELGFVAGEMITVISNARGNLILQVKDARIAVDETMARRIMVG
ncbi:FeoA family protein [Eubacterium oxidoreducens]|uniref:Ferrous iron transport protein A n=1 Tax=Eubacterium oxidoreducens TaxID=1732 RepID=A0A1G6BMX5_EUBOX|nr:FeoA family protein [Eubacterium oxidoreducens]SDB21958.1 ferrous iron transport protein A [Eubacterium oxidoreducens]